MLVEDCLFDQNSGLDWGGAAAVRDANLLTIFNRCAFTNNMATTAGTTNHYLKDSLQHLPHIIGNNFLALYIRMNAIR